MKSILNLCQEVADLAAVKQPESLFLSKSMSDEIFLSVAKSALESLLRYGDWPELIRETVLQTYPNRYDYPLEEFCPDFYSLIQNTIYIKDKQEKIIGAITPQQWMHSKYFYDENNQVKFQIQNGMIKFLSLPDYPLKIVFQYRSNVICFTPKTWQFKSRLTSDNDIPVFDEYLVKLGILWRWLKRSGLDYSEEYAEYERELKKKFSVSYCAQDIPLDYSDESPFSQGVKINVKVIH